jgi:DNA topoisomerase-2
LRQGPVEVLSADKFQVSGIAEKVNETTIDILELPIYKWTESYKEQLEKWVIDGVDSREKDKDKEKEKGKEQERFIKVMPSNSSPLSMCSSPSQDYREHHNGQRIHFSLTMSKEAVEKAEKEGLLSYLKLTTTISTANMMCFDPEGRIKKYSSPEEILEEFYPRRLEFYQKRKVRIFTLVSTSPRLKSSFRPLCKITCKTS